ncbi:hypothetical protein [Maliponia aquimaris]|uniref:DUF2865 domain-containing protein n=1 Tax=Maliponia aquimaris TaxID=1673631 RepID=A0A238KFG3_9RHOB|nr:hypothetical protein [Maliponia aquimaris]SMX40756.1 hypothetical protein MAA8898_02242 [Maliponia aquimaris]
MKGKAGIPARAALAALLPFACALPAAGQGSFAPPEGCESYLTVQAQNCVVTNHYVCPAIDPEHQFRTDFGEAGPYFTSRIDNKAHWVSSGPPDDPEETRTVPPPGDPGDVDELIANGVDTFDFYQESPQEGRTRITGYDRIVGEIEIDGEPLFRTEFEMTRTDESGRVIEHVTGKEYVSERHRRFFAGFAADVIDGREAAGIDRSPVEFIYPGEPGFGATYPRYGCELISQGPGAEPRLWRAAARRSDGGIPRFIGLHPKMSKAVHLRQTIAGPSGRPADDAAAYGLVPRPGALFDGQRVTVPTGGQS